MPLNLEKQPGQLDFGITYTAFVILFFMGSLALFDQDEAAYAGFGLMMERTGDYLIPEFLWSEPHRKTPFHFWSIAGMYKLIGPSEFATRVPAMLAMILTWVTCWFQARPLFGSQITRNATYLMMASLLTVVYGGISFTDAPLMLTETVAALAILRLWRRVEWHQIALLFLATAFGGLVKGPPVYILTLGMTGLLWLAGITKVDKHLRIASLPTFWLQPLWMLVILLGTLPLIYWGYLCNEQDGGIFISWLWDWYVAKRAGGFVWGQTGPPGYHLIIMAIAFLPVVAWFPGMVQHSFKLIRHKVFLLDHRYFLLLIWLIPGWLFYELQLSKLPSYALGAYVAFALLLADYIDKEPMVSKRSLWLQVGIILLISLAAVIVVQFALFGQILFNNNMLAGSGVIVPIVALAMLVFPVRASFNVISIIRSTQASQLPLPLTREWLVSFSTIGIVVVFVLVLLEPIRGGTLIVARKVDQLYKPGQPAVMLATNYSQPSLPFYLASAFIPYRYTEDVSLITSYADSLKAAKKPLIMICDPGKLNDIRQAAPALLANAKIDSLQGLATDRVQGSNFRIVQLNWAKP